MNATEKSTIPFALGTDAMLIAENVECGDNVLAAAINKLSPIADKIEKMMKQKIDKIYPVCEIAEYGEMYQKIQSYVE